MPRRINRVVLLCSLSAFALAAEGCRREPTWDLAPVEGIVTKDGRPLPRVEVVFLADLNAGTQGPKAGSFTDETGHYRLRNDNGGDGAVVGKHRVVLLDPTVRKGRLGRVARGPQPKNQRWAPEIAQRLEDQLKPAADTPRLPSSYGRFNETPLRIEVRPGSHVLDFDVKDNNIQVK